MAGTWARGLAVGAAAAVGALAIVVPLAPAAWLGAAIEARSGGRIVFAETQGTVWRGSSEVYVAAGGGEALLAARVPGRAAWRLSAWRLFTGTLDLTLADAAVLDRPLEIQLDRSGASTIAPGRLRLPAEILVGLGAPWNTIRPGGAIELAWGTLHADAMALRGDIAASWTAAASSLCPVVPFGEYRLRASGVYDGARIELETLSGPMEMTGSGTIADGLRVRFRGHAQVRPGTDAAVAGQLSGLISLLGLRDADGAVLNFGT